MKANQMWVDMRKSNRPIWGGNRKTNNEEPDGIIPDSVNYGEEINHIEISHERTRTPNEPLAEDEQTISRSELGKLMRVARIALPGAIYDASAARKHFMGVNMIEVLEEKDGFSEMRERKIFRKKVRMIFRTKGC